MKWGTGREDFLEDGHLVVFPLLDDHKTHSVKNTWDLCRVGLKRVVYSRDTFGIILCRSQIIMRVKITSNGWITAE